ncbi:Na+-transporting NADH:ubiquinone oxidoreductase subunit C [Zhouia amylolytica]|uniref:Na(+)-translocating NADH-quinone reductase subunit C n=2 Tax=Zhouia amylolytica TaxID=376730 RepID=W2ULL2_9FLAO|nr:NADH:ubiquinone reductase (Na(+)-transporting) subunit C [Zhouia amylolytica]ETN94859.1 na(+)-translocating NADH-quinone reductase subunit C [Zhouia amylolytica AD3]MCQ0112879.1 NADH:ubiquinone reductase (Na(+)-transporting) subunit C [Zhouia amylolytica]SFS66912.1 Na+-transporting NADH:ubiquinone oxidoreductase subunit C [Zhouia amylolytica]
MNRDSNIYIFSFAAIMVVIVASVLSFTAVSLKPRQQENVRNEKMQSILHTIGVEVERDGAQAKYDEFIKEELSLKADGTVDESVDAFKIELNKELKKPVEEQRFPLFVADVDGEKFYIVPLRGAGLWNAIWGYISLKEDMNTVKGTIFDHAGETPGLGAEITQSWFQERFVNEKIFNANDELVGIAVQKGYSGGNDKDDNAVDAISGATITGDGVTDMIKERLLHYVPYFEKNNSKLAIK